MKITEEGGVSGTARRTVRDRGVSMIEAAVAVPFVVALALGLLWVAVFLGSSASFDAAFTKALRLATRGRVELVGKEIIQAVHSWSSSTIPSDLEPLLTANVDAADAANFYDDPVTGVFINEVAFHQLPPEYIYTFIYLKEALVESIGGTIRFPCDPRLSGDPKGGPGCVKCVLFNPKTLADNPAWNSDPLVDGPIPARQLAVECEYQPHNFILSPLFRMLAIVAGEAAAPTIVITRRQMIQWETAETRSF